MILRKSAVEITKNNDNYLQFIDIFKYASVDMLIKNIDKVVSFYESNNLDFKTLQYWTKFYSNSVKKTIRESKIYDELALRLEIFKDDILEISVKIHVVPAIIEKDYYVTFFLKILILII